MLKRVVSAVFVAGIGLATAVARAHAGSSAVVAAAALANASRAAVVSAPVPPNVSGALALSAAASAADMGASAATPASRAGRATGDRPSTAPEPSGYWTGPTNSPVPATLSGAKVITNAHQLRALLDHQHPALIDVSNAPRRPDNMAAGAPWLPLPHRAIPGTVWIPGPGAGEIPAPVDTFFRQQLAKATHNDPTRPVVIYCHESCWLSWNAAKRAVSYGYQHVYWYRDGIEGWKAAGLPTAVIEPQTPPES